MVAEAAVPQIHGVRVRICRLDTNGVPRPGAGNMIVSKALTQLKTTPVYRDGDEVTEVNAGGELCLDYRADDNLRRGDVELTVCTHDPYLMELMSGGTVLQDADAVGYAEPEIGPIRADHISIEVWARRITDGVEDPDYPYAWWVCPRVKNLRSGERTFANASSLPMFTGQAYENPNWYDGPANDFPAASDRWRQWIPTKTLPTLTNGYATIPAS